MPEPYKIVRTYEYQETAYFDSEGMEVATDRIELSDCLVSEEAPEPCEQWEIDDYELEADHA